MRRSNRGAVVVARRERGPGAGPRCEAHTVVREREGEAPDLRVREGAADQDEREATRTCVGVRLTVAVFCIAAAIFAQQSRLASFGLCSLGFEPAHSRSALQSWLPWLYQDSSIHLVPSRSPALSQPPLPCRRPGPARCSGHPTRCAARPTNTPTNTRPANRPTLPPARPLARCRRHVLSAREHCAYPSRASAPAALRAPADRRTSRTASGPNCFPGLPPPPMGPRQVDSGPRICPKQAQPTAPRGS